MSKAYSASPRIQKLDAILVNKIAAGEVIERPASVVKELVENSLDAGATRIDIALEVGGSQLIRVTDDGCGIDRDNLSLAVASHATSKILTSDDLFHIATLGFRGEALASIGSVSHLTLRSRPAGQLEANEIVVEGGAVAAPKPCGAPIGTTIEIRNLFYNVPARRKFLRQPQTECGHVTEQLARIALAHPHVAFTFTHNDRSLRNLPPTNNRRERIADFYGAELGACLIELARNERNLRVEGLIAPPSHSRATGKWQYLFLNGRFITDRRIGYAVREAFRGLVEHDRYPVTFLFLTTDPAEFDVNVHPTKIEVRWRDAGLVQSQVLSVLRETLLAQDLTPRFRTPVHIRDDGMAPSPLDTSAQERARHALADYLKRVDPTQPRLTFRAPPFPTNRLRPSIANVLPTPSLTEADQDDARNGKPMDSLRDVIEAGAYESDSVALSTDGSYESVGAPQDVAASQIPNAALGGVAGALPPGGVIQIHNTYLVAQTEAGVVIIDQHALHERILYERFRERVLQGPLESQGLLLPETLEVSPAQREAATAHKELFERIGIELSEYGPKSIAVQRFPTLLASVDMKTFVSDLLERLVETDGDTSDETLIHATLDMMACKAAIKAGDPLSQEEMYALLDQRHLTQRSSNCPHGRPTTLELTTKDLEKQFKRI
ncbi:MAG: DNA mismatch repair endonuclease MutL [Phycisphaerales bacterium]|nr:DNA mismatch repair endonuclease MutL [Phycisphaerales bacterium]MCB9856289.1 DNA mismatch repair endonuclease MutL [Phycisphaerales bacterium]MCB9863272.1 DNA mismatch repair endonuclease MutL [Phycisphaerales bacterium]